jgi:hypothetical protein
MTARVVSLASARRVSRDAARARHPAARSWAPDRALVLERLADRAGRRGAAWPRVAAAAVMLRGIAGDDPATFAGRVGLSIGEVAALEQGHTAPPDVPTRLRQVVHLVDWAWVDDDPGGGPQGF